LLGLFNNIDFPLLDFLPKEEIKICVK